MKNMILVLIIASQIYGISTSFAIDNTAKIILEKQINFIEEVNKLEKKYQNTIDENTLYKIKSDLGNMLAKIRDEKLKSRILDIKQAIQEKINTVNNDKNLEVSSTYTRTNDENNINDAIKISVAGATNSLYYYIGAILGFVSLILSFVGYKIGHKTQTTKQTHTIDLNANTLTNTTNTKILQILKTQDEYSIEYNGVYNKGIKVAEENKEDITKSINKLVVKSNMISSTRGLMDDLQNLNIDLPTLEEYGNTLYKLFLPQNIRTELKTQTGPLIIKTDAQDIPWEIMHDGEDFLSLKFPMARQIMSKEKINIQKGLDTKQNKKTKILFIVNPTSDLNGSEKELEAIVSHIESKAEINFLRQDAVTASNVLSLISSGGFDIIHYAGHAHFDRENPMDSSLILANSQKLTANEIKRVMSGSPLIFLNACSSGVIKENKITSEEEDMMGLSSSFVLSGAKGVISTLWPVNDSLASIFAKDLYKNLLDNKTIRESILESKKLTYNYNKQNPTWASFIYYGDPNDKIKL